jgi:mRNA interferase MazF
VKEPHRGEVWWGEVENVGRRPFLILTRDGAIPVLSRLVCAPITRTIRGIPTELALGRNDGMPEDCVASFDNLLTLPKAALTKFVTALTIDNRLEMCRVLRIAMEC